MQNLKVFLAVGAVGLAAAVAVACSSSSSQAPANNNNSDDASDNTPSDAAMSCVPLTTSGLCPTGSGLTCCLSGITGTCTPVAECTGNIQVQCNSAATCSAGQSCCADIGGSAIAALLDGGFDAAAFDASAILEAGPSGAAGLLAGVNFKVTCQTACSATQIQACASDAECNGGKCVPLTQLIDAGSVDAGSFSSIIASAGMNKACIPADGGLPGLPGSDASTSDASSDAETTPDAPAAVDSGSDAAKEAAP
jgi:hypothetical protein